MEKINIIKNIFLLSLIFLSFLLINHFIKQSKLLKKNSMEIEEKGDEIKIGKIGEIELSLEKQKIQNDLNRESYLIRVETPAEIQKEEQKNYKNNFHQFYEEIQDISNEPVNFENIFRDQIKENYGKTSISLRKKNYY